ncbi:hypothetical protein JW752_01190 [Candidatus Peregrinibacteria bacterium]|nr:hypothetical protein [Candidatus Peregrinibacteria bacterium]
MKNCKQCNTGFDITDTDRDFYKKIDVPEPILCPDCRNQRRMSWRNEKTLHKRKCDLCSKDIVSIYSPDKPFPVYCQECFWGDKWNALDYGQGFDFNRPFFDQFEELMLKVPRLAIVNKQSQNSDYCNYSFANKNCYLTFGNHYEEDCMYGRYSTKNKNCLDYLFTYNSQLCYEISFTKNSYESVYLEHCDGCQSCLFSSNLIGCKHCLLCSNLNHKEYHILNQPYSKEDYFEKLKEYQLETYPGFQKTRTFFKTEFKTQFPHRATYQVNCEDSIGDNLNHCRNVRDCFDCTNCEDIAYAVQIDETYDSMDMTCMGYDRSEVCYETIGCSGIFNCLSCDSCWHNHDLFYCNTCFSAKSCFGCISLQHKNYCILNKQYPKNEYEELKSKIVEHMRKTGEWGLFFPTDISPYAYNETIANEYYPLNKDEIGKRSWKWKKEEDKVLNVTKTIPASRLPDTISEIPDDVLNWAIECEETGRPFKIQKQELAFYRKLNLPFPHFHPDVRFGMRMQRRRPRKLSDIKCDQCGAKIKSSFPTVQAEKVYCEKCFLKHTE